MNEIDTLARRFADTASELGIAMTEEVNRLDPELTAKVAHALDSGERLVLSIDFALDATCIRLETVDGHEFRKRVMTINARQAGAH